jgi:glycosyltransferase involved in cell wall biosynthesis
MKLPRVNLFTPGLVAGDAVSNDVFGMADWLRRRGFPVAVYAEKIDDGLEETARPVGAYRGDCDDARDVMLYHHSVGWPKGLAIWRQTRGRKILRYHNVTPDRFYQPFDQGIARQCQQGVRETASLSRSGPTLALAASDYGVRDLARWARRPYPLEIVPPFHDAGAWEGLPLNEELAERLRGRINVLFVGRVMPHKGHARLLRVLSCCRTLLGSGVRLYVVGGLDEQMQQYNARLREQIEALRLGDLVCFTGKVPLDRLKTYFHCADAFLCLSEHEGFCVPLVEAMRMGVPVVAYRGSAIASTLGDHPLLWDGPDPWAAAESVRLLVEDSAARRLVVGLQRDRYERLFSPGVIGRRFAEALASVFPEVDAEVTDEPASLVPGVA